MYQPLYPEPELPSTGGLLAQTGMSLHKRCVLFYTVCVPVRMLVAAVVSVFCNDQRLTGAGIVAVASCLGIFTNLTANKRVWWRPAVHTVTSLLTLLLAGLLFGNFIPGYVVGVPLACDVLAGLLLSLYVRPFRPVIVAPRVMVVVAEDHDDD